MSQNEQKKADNFEQIEETLTKGERFIEKNQKKLSYIVIFILAVILIGLAYNRYVLKPKAEEAVEQMFIAQRYFERDSFKLALNGDGNTPGFLEIIEDYGSTPSGNLAHLYAGLCYLHTNKYDEAISHLKKFSSDDFLLGNMAIANIGDAYMQMGKYGDAASEYSKAASKKVNDFSTPTFLFKAGFAYEKAGNFKSALEAYKAVEKNHPKSTEARDIEKYITRAKAKL